MYSSSHPRRLLAAFLLLPVLAAAAAPRPNILFILADDFGWNGPACYGNRDVATPHLDRLAADGVRFTAAYADAQCSPTRAAFFSGQYGARSGVFKVIHEQEPPRAFLRIPTPNLALSPGVATLATTLRRAGYATGLSGKWHIADDYPAATLRARDGGGYFDRTLAALAATGLATGLATDPATPAPGKSAPLVIATGYELCRIPSIDPQPHDIPMDWLVTERGLYRREAGRLVFQDLP